MKKEIISRQAIRQVLKDYGREYAKRPVQSIVGLASPSIGVIFAFFIPPLILARIVNILSKPGTVSLASVAGLVALFGASWLVGEFFARVGDHFLIRIKERAISSLNTTAFERLSGKDYMFFTNMFVGSLTKRASSFVYGFESMTDLLAYNILTNVIPFIFAFVVLWKYSPFFPLMLTVALALMIAVVIPLIKKRARLVDIRQEAGSKVTGILADSVMNMMTVKSFAREKAELARYKEAAGEHGVAYRAAADFNNLKINPFISPLYALTNIAGLILSIYLAGTGTFPIGSMVVVFSYFLQITYSFWEVNNVYRTLENTMSGGGEFTQMFLTPSAVLDAPDATELRVTDAAVSFKNVSFGYREVKSGKGFLHGFNLEIPKYQKVGLVGPSGSGKTTITKLVLRFLDIQAGSIQIDGQDISKVTQESLRSAISYVPQEPLLFHRTLRENIAYGVDHASDREVVEAAKLAHAHEFITRLSKGYHTMVGERGVKLSGGQRQRVAIARAILKNSPILVLDEATSSLDSESEKYIQEGLAELMKGKTALVIAHRLSTIRNLDRILVLDKGRIVQDGTHDELIRQEGLYAKLWSHQSGEFLE